MVKKLGTKKNRSNRLTIRQKKKQMKKAVLHDRASRKAAKFAKMGGSRLQKDPGIPNLWPFKEKLLRKAERDRQKAEAEKAENKQKKALERAKRKKEMKSIGQVDTMAALAAERARIYEARKAKMIKAVKSLGEGQSNRDKVNARKTRRQYYTMMQQLVKKADIVIEVLDARDPIGCRATVRVVFACGAVGCGGFVSLAFRNRFNIVMHRVPCFCMQCLVININTFVPVECMHNACTMRVQSVYNACKTPFLTEAAQLLVSHFAAVQSNWQH